MLPSHLWSKAQTYGVVMFSPEDFMLRILIKYLRKNGPIHSRIYVIRRFWYATPRMVRVEFQYVKDEWKNQNSIDKRITAMLVELDAEVKNAAE